MGKERRNAAKQRLRVWQAVCLVGVVVAVCAACGSSSSSGSSSNQSTTSQGPADAGATGSGETGSTATGSPIVIGSINTFSGALSNGLSDSKDTEQAWVNWTNAHGGVLGHPIKLITVDDGGLPATALQDAEKLVEQDHVVAFVANMSGNDAAYASYVEQKQIPVIGGTIGSFVWEQNPDFYPEGQTGIATIGERLLLAKQSGASRYGYLYGAGNAAALQGVAFNKAMAKKIGGISIAYATGISSTAPNYTAPCLAAQAAHVQALEVGDAPTVLASVATSCAAQGFNPQWIAAFGETDGSDLKVPALNGVKIALLNFPWMDSSTAATKTYQQAMTQYAPEFAGENGDSNTAQVWASFQLFQTAIEAAHPTGDVTTADILNGLWSLKNETLGGLAPPLTFPKGQPHPIACGFVAGIQGGKWTEPQGLKLLCGPATITSS